MVIRPPQGYFPEPTKRILVVSPRNIPWVEAFFWDYRLHMVTGTRYIGGFVGSKADQYLWLGEKVEGWRDLVSTLGGVVCRHPQTTYTGLQKSLQQECSFLPCVTLDVGIAFQLMGDEMRDIFLLALFQGATT